MNTLKNLKALIRAAGREAATPAPIPLETELAPRQWKSEHRYTAIGTQCCSNCGSVTKYIAGRFIFQRSGTVTRSVRIDSPAALESGQNALPHSFWLLEPENYTFCASCVGLTDEAELPPVEVITSAFGEKS